MQRRLGKETFSSRYPLVPATVTTTPHVLPSRPFSSPFTRPNFCVLLRQFSSFTITSSPPSTADSFCGSVPSCSLRTCGTGEALLDGSFAICSRSVSGVVKAGNFALFVTSLTLLSARFVAGVLDSNLRPSFRCNGLNEGSSISSPLT